MTESNNQAITATMDGRPVSAAPGTTILQAARMHGIYIPTLCYLECLPEYGGCRLCMVEVENMRGYPTACTTPLSQGMRISTKTKELQKLRQAILELILSEHPYTCLVCKEKKECHEYMHSTRKASTTTGCNFCTRNGSCELQNLVEYLFLEDIRFPIIYRNLAPVTDNPFYTLDYNLCILCGRCVRICNEERFSEVLAFINRGNAALVGTAFDETQKQAGCEFCGACVDVCPTGSLSQKMGSWVGLPDKSTDSSCIFCGIACDITVNTKGNRIVNIGPEPGKRDNPKQLCVRGKFIAADISHHPQRITRPHIKKHGKWKEASWEEAITVIAGKLKAVGPGRFAAIGSAHDTVESCLSLQKFARQALKSANLDISPSLGCSTIVKDIHEYYLAHGHTKIDDIPAAESIYVIGAQAQWSHAIIENRIRKAYKAGKEVIVAASRENRTVKFSTAFRQYKKGGEHIFLSTLMEELALRKSSTTTVMVIGDEVLHSERAEENFSYLMKICKHSGPVVKMLFLMPEGNRYGAVMAGMNPVLLPGFTRARKKGLSINEMLHKKNTIDALYLVGDISLAPSCKDISFIIQQNLFFTPFSQHAHVFLPLQNSMESEGHIVNLEGKVKKLVPVVSAHAAILPTSEVIGRIARAMGKRSLAAAVESAGGQIESLMKKSQTMAKKKMPALKESPGQRVGSKKGQLTRENLRKYHFHYLGNDLQVQIPDLEKVLQE